MHVNIEPPCHAPAPQFVAMARKIIAAVVISLARPQGPSTVRLPPHTPSASRGTSSRSLAMAAAVTPAGNLGSTRARHVLVLVSHHCKDVREGALKKGTR